MGRELRRVPLDFSWPLNKIWQGFINPHFKRCPEQDKTCWGGSTAAGRWVDSICRMLELIGEQSAEAASGQSLAQLRRGGRLFPHPYLEQWPMAPSAGIPESVMDSIREEHEEYRDRIRAFERWRAAHPGDSQNVPLTAELLAFVEGLAGGKLRGMGGGDSWAIQKRLREMAGVPESFGECPVCGGEGIDPVVKEAYEAWEKTDPPEGPGFQLWETISEGSPISPVFPTEEAFIRYLTGEGYSDRAARAFVKTGWAPSMVVAGGEVYSGIEAAGVLSPGE